MGWRGADEAGPEVYIMTAEPKNYRASLSKSINRRCEAKGVIIYADSAYYSDGFKFDTEYGQGVGVSVGRPRQFFLDYAAILEQGEYELWLEYAAEEPRPVNMVLNGTGARRLVADATTGGWYRTHQQWLCQTTLAVNSSGMQLLHFWRIGWFPHISRIALVLVKTPSSR